jgi:hypothetical protein
MAMLLLSLESWEARYVGAGVIVRDADHVVAGRRIALAAVERG